MLSSHGGEIFLHVLNSNRSTLEDPPSISEGCGGRVTDYRITVRSTHSSCVKINDSIILSVKLKKKIPIRILVNLWGRTGWLQFQSLPMILRGSYLLRGPKLSWSVTPDTGQWSSPRPPSSTCRRWAPSTHTQPSPSFNSSRDFHHTSRLLKCPVSSHFFACVCSWFPPKGGSFG